MPDFRVLVADDVSGNCKLMVRILQRLHEDWNISTVVTAEEVVTLVQEAHAKTTPFNLLVIDENFGDCMKGSTAIVEIRATEQTRTSQSKLAIISWTSDADTISEVLLERGADHVWGKPLPELSTLQDDLQRILPTES